jgi:NAD-dependent DNA ligase
MKAISLTGVGLKEEKKAKTIIAALCCKFDRNLAKNAYVLVVKKVGSAKYLAALEFGIPMMTIEWLHDCERAGRLLDVCDSDVVSKYGVSSLTGLSVSFTGFTPPERSSIKSMVEQQGGAVSDGLVEGVTSHLVVADDLNVNSNFVSKYEAALMWHIKIVRHAWLKDCWALKRWVPEEDYAVDSPVDSASTPNTGESAARGADAKISFPVMVAPAPATR